MNINCLKCRQQNFATFSGEGVFRPQPPAGIYLIVEHKFITKATPILRITLSIGATADLAVVGVCQKSKITASIQQLLKIQLHPTPKNFI